MIEKTWSWRQKRWFFAFFAGLTIAGCLDRRSEEGANISPSVEGIAVSATEDDWFLGEERIKAAYDQELD